MSATRSSRNKVKRTSSSPDANRGGGSRAAKKSKPMSTSPRVAARGPVIVANPDMVIVCTDPAAVRQLNGNKAVRKRAAQNGIGK
jgi:hypothetical protein